jgi:hypothetical protein
VNAVHIHLSLHSAVRFSHSIIVSVSFLQAEEEEYTSRIIQQFSSGLLTLPEGATLRSYLADTLNCDPMRITKKFTGACCLGRRVYHLRDRNNNGGSGRPSLAEMELAKAEVDHLEQRFRLRVEHEQLGLPMPLAARRQQEQMLLVAQPQPQTAQSSGRSTTVARFPLQHHPPLISTTAAAAPAWLPNFGTSAPNTTGMPTTMPSNTPPLSMVLPGNGTRSMPGGVSVVQSAGSGFPVGTAGTMLPSGAAGPWLLPNGNNYTDGTTIPQLQAAA